MIIRYKTGWRGGFGMSKWISYSKAYCGLAFSYLRSGGRWCVRSREGDKFFRSVNDLYSFYQNCTEGATVYRPNGEFFCSRVPTPNGDQVLTRATSFGRVKRMDFHQLEREIARD